MRARRFLPFAAACCGLAAVATFATLPAWSGDEPPAAPARKPDVSTMDLDLLRENLLKIWIVEESSERYNQMRIAQKSFELLTPYQETGDPALDEQNRKDRAKAVFKLRAYLQMELDGSIEVVDTIHRVLGRQTSRSSEERTKDKLLKETLAKTLPSIDWREVHLADALADLGRKAGVPIKFSGLPKGVECKVTLQLDEGATLLMAIDYLKSFQSIEWKFENGTFFFDYTGEVPARPYGR